MSYKNELGKEIKGKLLRVTAALYRVTDLLSDEEPLKWGMRRDATRILDCGYGGDCDYSRISESLHQKLVLAKTSGFISAMNFDAIEGEYESVINVLKRSQREDENDSGHEVTVLDVPEIAALAEVNRVENNAENVENVEVSEPVDDPNEASAVHHVEERKKSILDVLEVGSWMSVSDAHARCIEKGISISKKTVQRDLSALAIDGVIKSEGDRRWKRYLLTQNQ